MAIWNEAMWLANTASFFVRIIITACISVVLGLPVSLFEWQIQTTATYWQGELFHLRQAQNVRANWPSAVVFAVCSSATCRPKQSWHEATQQAAFVAASSLKKKKSTAMAGNRTQVNCLEGSYARHYTTIAAQNGFHSKFTNFSGHWDWNEPCI